MTLFTLIQKCPFLSNRLFQSLPLLDWSEIQDSRLPPKISLLLTLCILQFKNNIYLFSTLNSMVNHVYPTLFPQKSLGHQDTSCGEVSVPISVEYHMVVTTKKHVCLY